MNNRDSKDAWAGIVNLDEASQSSQAPENEWEQSEGITQDQTLVDSLPLIANKEEREFDRSKTDKFDHAEITDPAVRTNPEQPKLRTSPIKEKVPDLGAVFDEPPETTNDYAQDSTSLPEAFRNDSPIANLDDTPSKSWDPKVKPTWREYKTTLLTGLVGVISISAVLLVDRSPTERVETHSPKTTSANRKLERIERARAGQLPDENKGPQGPSSVAGQKTPEKAPSSDTAKENTSRDKESIHAVPKPVLPMMSILSEPLGALVEINGKVYGKTPLIRQSPQSTGSLKVRLRFKHHETLDTTVWPNKDGHYEAKLILRKK